MPKKVTAYACEFGCGWVSATERSAKFHEERCVYSPQNQSCHTCDYAIDMMHTAGGWITECSHPDRQGPEWHRDFPIFFCDFYTQKEVMPME
jgi:hypothetical protein